MPGYHIDRITEDIKREIVAILRELKDQIGRAHV